MKYIAQLSCAICLWLGLATSPLGAADGQDPSRLRYWADNTSITIETPTPNNEVVILKDNGTGHADAKQSCIVAGDRIQAWLDFASHFIWPAASIFLVLLFRKQIREMADRLQKAKTPSGWEATFGSLPPEGPQRVSPDQSITLAESRLGYRVNRNIKVNLANVGNIYWLGHDISSAIMAFQLGADRRQLLYLLTQCRHHAHSLQISDPSLETRLTAMIERLSSLLEADLTAERRRLFARDLLVIRDEVGAIMEVSQKDFVGFAR